MTQNNLSLEEVKKLLENIKRVANNALALDDNSDYGEALGDICSLIDPTWDYDKIKYIEILNPEAPLSDNQ